MADHSGTTEPITCPLQLKNLCSDWLLERVRKCLPLKYSDSKRTSPVCCFTGGFFDTSWCWVILDPSHRSLLSNACWEMLANCDMTLACSQVELSGETKRPQCVGRARLKEQVTGRGCCWKEREERVKACREQRRG